MHTRTIRYAALVGVMVLILPERTLACGWSCRDAAPGLRRPAPSYGYRAYLAQLGRHQIRARPRSGGANDREKELPGEKMAERPCRRALGEAHASPASRQWRGCARVLTVA